MTTCDTGDSKLKKNRKESGRQDRILFYNTILDRYEGVSVRDWKVLGGVVAHYKCSYQSHGDAL